MGIIHFHHIKNVQYALFRIWTLAEWRMRLCCGVHSQYMKTNMTAARPALMPAISFPPLAAPFLVLVASAAEPVPVGVVLDVVVVLPPTCCVCPTVGSLTSPSTNQPPAVELGQAGGVKVGL